MSEATLSHLTEHRLLRPVATDVERESFLWRGQPVFDFAGEVASRVVRDGPRVSRSDESRDSSKDGRPLRAARRYCQFYYWPSWSLIAS